MEIFAFVLLGLILLTVVYGIALYNSLVGVKHQVNKAWSNIDVALKQRHDELPKLVATCKQYMQHERETLENVIQARNSVADARSQKDVKKVGQAESVLRMGLGNLFALAENYPELKADRSFARLETRVIALESQIADRREFYNEAVNIINTRIEQFPDVLLARWFNFIPAELLEFDAEEIHDVNMGSLFG